MADNSVCFNCVYKLEVALIDRKSKKVGKFINLEKLGISGIKLQNFYVKKLSCNVLICLSNLF